MITPSFQKLQCTGYSPGDRRSVGEKEQNEQHNTAAAVHITQNSNNTHQTSDILLAEVEKSTLKIEASVQS